ncbi:ATP-binding protein [Prevotella cerevisiae]|uniref:ATP-binding protein n=1 Tax=Segatella cerevisiae TaxID=2053716 RepID=A0ABT1BZR1_9BACT|nr:ATP-binding protein [Segatella cerevisiae]MCO6026572.1 ATP-binding protein [Segatella cerevisiae]
MIRKFDLNIERILDNWELKHAVREIIANAIDEQKLSGTSDIQIFKRNGEWIVKDFGRGLKYEDFTQNENNEKLSAKGIIGRFGIGLKDALATFDRNQVSVLILSKYGKITLGRSHKNGFDDVVTLHAYIDDPIDKNMVGTEFHLKNIPDEAIENAKKLFLKFNDYQIVGRTKYGDIIENSGYYSKIYVNGVLVATEDNFLFSYNITSINTQLKKSMNRERTNVGRTAYASIVRAMLLECKDEKVAEELSNDFKGYSYGNTHDELKWIDVQRHAVQIMNEKHNAIFVTSKNIQENNDLVTEARDGGENHNGSDIIVIPENLYNKLSDDNESKPEEQKVRTFDQFVTERSNNFEYKFTQVSEVKRIDLFNK